MLLQRPRHTSPYRANGFLRSLATADAALITPLLTQIDCQADERLGADSYPDAQIFFPVTMVVSLGIDDGDSGIGLIGREGVIGWSGVLGREHADHGARVLLDGGAALALPVSRMRMACFASPTLSMSLLRFVQAYTVQLSCMIRANARSTLQQRLSALLLMLHDRIDGDSIRITHEALAMQLQVRRASVTDLLHVLEGELAVRCERRSIQVRNRRALERCAGMAYGTTEDAYRRSIGPFGKMAGKMTLAPGSATQSEPAALHH